MLKYHPRLIITQTTPDHSFLTKNLSPTIQSPGKSVKLLEYTTVTMDTAGDFVNSSDTGEIPSYNGSEKAKATDFANYFCSYAELHHQKQMLADHNRMAAYHSSILGNTSVFKDKIVMDVGTVRVFVFYFLILFILYLTFTFFGYNNREVEFLLHGLHKLEQNVCMPLNIQIWLIMQDVS